MLLPENMRRGFQVTAFDEREAIGGLWVPQDKTPPPPATPATPLYPNLRTNGPHPVMTIPDFPVQPNTPLLAPRASVLRYWQSVMDSTPLAPGTQVFLQHSVTRARWVGSESSGEWHLTARDLVYNTTRDFAFDHLLVAPGVNRIPRIPYLAGQDEWFKAGKTLMHCMWYRDTHIFDNKTVLVVGSGPSGLDLVRHSKRSAKKVFWSRSGNLDGPKFDPFPGVQDVPRLANLTNGVVTLLNGTTLPEVDLVMLATGYNLHVPFLTAGGFLDEVDKSHSVDRLTTNSRYIHPLYEHTLSLDPRYPLGSLYFISIMTYNPTGLTNYAQALFAAYTIADPSFLDSREELLEALSKREARIREIGRDPAVLGHRTNPGYGAFGGHLDAGPMQDLMVHSLRDRGLGGYPGIPTAGFNFTPTWHLYSYKHTIDIVEGWHARLEVEGDSWEADFVAGQKTEADYLDSMRRFTEWWLANKKNYTVPDTN
ncbi:FAD/NAD(P)-binding domain-containing protein [Auriculariales sp. MPI-PUGE-AT-0066]|nr:FAD/NAD(P)-binding domain-containing protein [Auriculariales sp. MPI-PUGE-AT-0066]